VTISGRMKFACPLASNVIAHIAPGALAESVQAESKPMMTELV
jgi:hypothetical protein